jgi:hypothetical protein
MLFVAPRTAKPGLRRACWQPPPKAIVCRCDPAIINLSVSWQLATAILLQLITYRRGTPCAEYVLAWRLRYQLSR